jgi:CubicO group peptidase (beta-lactamase class C family)
MPPYRRHALFLLALAGAVDSTTQSTTPLQRAARYSAERDGDAVLVFRHDSLVLEDYQNGYDGRDAHGLASGTKAFACALVAVGQQDGLFRLDDPVSRAIPEFRGDSVKARVTLRQLVNLTSGIAPDIANPDDYASAVSLPVTGIPGERFAYGGAGSHILAELIRRKRGGEDAAAYLNRRALQPLGIAATHWARDAAGRPHMASGAAMTGRDWGKYGLLLLHDGVWGGRRVLPAGAVRECRRGSDANPWFGLGLWLNARTPATPAPAGVVRVGLTDRRLFAPDLPSDIFLAAGTGGQRLYVLPTPGLVIVRLGHNRGPEFKDDEFLRLALGKR